MMLLVLAVIGISVGVLYGFFRRLRHIEEELWGAKQAEAAETAEAEAASAERKA
jgi:hypothetical protein